MLDTSDLSKFVQYEALKDNGKISSVLIKHVNLPEIVEYLYESVDPKNNLKDTLIHQHFNMLGQEQKLLLASQMLITRYCIHRVLTHFKVYNSNAWTYKTGADYYGEEIQMIGITSNLAKQIENVLETLKNKNISEKIELILQLEYGHLIPSVIKRKWFVQQVSIDDMYFSNEEHYQKCKDDLDLADQESYRQSLAEYPYPRAISILNPDGKYKVIDGYHRLVSSQNNQDPLIIYCLRD